MSSYIVMNVITVPDDRREMFEERFRTRAGQVKNNAGFEAFELMRPADGKNEYIVYTRWASEGDFKAWLSSPDFAAGHRQHSDQGPAGTKSELWTFDLVEGEYA